jgi:2,3-bisphosphoglycerate-independent phosphoglycerate mutase
MIFLDGVGIGKVDYQFNPFFKFGFNTFSKIFGQPPSLENRVLKNGEAFLFPADPRLGVEGFPQSGTGQTSIFCGINAAKFVGKHFGPYPYSTLIPILKDKSIFKYFIDKNKKVSFANAYPKIFFDYLKSGKSRLGVTSISCLQNNIRLNTSTDVRKGKALTAEITNERWNIKLGYKLRKIKPQTAARRLLKIAKNNSFTLYEYYLTDYVGHGRYDGEIEQLMKILDDFLYTVITELDKNITLVICSDHGNIEDLSIKTHTLNPALTITAGKYAEQLFNSIKDISQIKQAIIKTFK